MRVLQVVFEHSKKIVNDVIEKYKDYRWEQKYLCKIV